MSKVSKYSLPPDPVMLYMEIIDQWYVESRFYWTIQEPTADSMTQGIGELSLVDLKYSYSILALLKSEDRITGGRVADCGGGIGRVSFQILAHFFDKIDIIDPIPHFLLKAREYIEKEVPVEVHQFGLEEWNPKATYDAFWIQWTLSYLTDTDLIAFLRRCKDHSTNNCLFLIKENIGGRDLDSDKSQYEYYPEKHSICRTYTHYCELFQKAGLVLEEYRVQPNWPDTYLTVVLFILHK